MIKDQGKARRRQVRYTAWLVLDGDQLHGCVLQDASDSGARIDVEDSKIVPDDFLLLLAGNASARRKCHVVWRTPRQVGVKFKGLAKKDQATRIALLDPEEETEQSELA